MTKTKLFAAAAVLTSLIASPVLAKDMDGMSNRAQIKKQRMMQNDRMTDRRADARFDRGYQRNDSGFFPVDIAAGVVGGAVATAGAIATAPFGGPNYAYNDDYAYNDGYGYRRGYRDSYASVNNYGRVGAYATAPYLNPYENNQNAWQGPFARRNDFVCVPGTVFTNENGIRTLCQ
jgi:Ni/Co efflux regulator RcnB